MAVYKDKKRGTWFVSYKNTTKRGFKTKFEAQQYEAKMRLQSDDITVGVRFHDVCEDLKRFKKERISHGSYLRIKRAIDNHIIPQTANKQLSNINRMDVRKFDEYVRSLDLATSSKRSIINYYKEVFKHSELYYNNNNNPTAVLELIPFTDEEKIQAVRNEYNVWSVEEFKSFISEVEGDYYVILFNILYLTGLRLGEALALNWNDFNGKSLQVSKSLTRKTNKGAYKIKAPKSHSSIRDVYTGNYLATMLENHLESEQSKEGFNDSWFILGGPKPLPQTTIDNKRLAAIKKSGVKRIRNHDLRHSHASNLISDGVSIAAVSQRLGHSDINITLKTYTHLVKDDNEKLLESINNSTKKL